MQLILITLLTTFNPSFDSFIPNFKSLFKHLFLYSTKETLICYRNGWYPSRSRFSVPNFNYSTSASQRANYPNRQTKAKNFLPLIREMDDLPLIRNFQSSCWKLFNLRQSNYRKRHFSVENRCEKWTILPLVRKSFQSQILITQKLEPFDGADCSKGRQKWIILPLVRTIFNSFVQSKSLAGNYSTCSPFNGDEKN